MCLRDSKTCVRITCAHTKHTHTPATFNRQAVTAKHAPTPSHYQARQLTEREREGERERERETDRDRERQRDRDRETETETDRQSQTDSERETKTERPRPVSYTHLTLPTRSTV